MVLDFAEANLLAECKDDSTVLIYSGFGNKDNISSRQSIQLNFNSQFETREYTTGVENTVVDTLPRVQIVTMPAATTARAISEA